MGYPSGFRTDTDALRAYARILYQEGDHVTGGVTSPIKYQASLPPSAFGRQVEFLPFDELFQAYQRAHRKDIGDLRA